MNASFKGGGREETKTLSTGSFMGNEALANCKARKLNHKRYMWCPRKAQPELQF